MNQQLEVAKHAFMQENVLIFETEPMKRTYRAVRYLLLIGGGLWMQAAPGGGKTAFIQYAAKSLRDELADTLVVDLPAHTLAPTATRSLPYRLCQRLGNPRPPLNGLTLRNELELRLKAHARSSSLSKVILLTDEWQAAKDHEFFLLKDSYNSLAFDGLGLSSLLGGEEPALGNRIRELKERPEGKGLTRRFAQREVPFSIYESVEDVDSACKAVDQVYWTRCEGRSVTAHLFPRAYANGFRLSGCSSLIWNGFGRKPMQGCDVFGTLRWLVALNAHADSPTHAIGETEVNRAILMHRGQA